MNKLFGSLVGIGGIVSLLSWPVSSATLSLNPSATRIEVGQTFTVDLNISGLGSQSAPSLASFFAEIVYQGNSISLESVTYGDLLGSPTDSVETDIVTTLDSNSASVDETSFLTTAELDALQPADFTLASLLFKAINTESSSRISFATIDFSDAQAHSFTPTLETASITIIPIPGALVLFLSAFCSLVVAGKNKTFGKRRSSIICR